jgi:hypothetical protein
MFTTMWGFLQDESNRAVLTWIGGGGVVIVGGLWAVVKFFLSKKTGKSAPDSTVTASEGGVAVRGNVQGSTIDTRGGTKR